MFKKVWGRRLRDAVGERRPPNASRTKHAPKTLDPTPFEDALGDATGDGLIHPMVGLSYPSGPTNQCYPCKGGGGRVVEAIYDRLGYVIMCYL
jgi:hypothetical protein